MPLFWNGMFSGFSSQPLYITMLYQIYNIVFTAVPIMWFSVMDFAYEKKVFLDNPNNYQLGIQNLCFSNYIFL